MTEQSTIKILEKLSFEEALEFTQTLLDRHATGALSETELQQAVTDLVASENGARGFFVVYLSDPRSQAAAPTNAIITALKTAPDVVAPLLVKNLVMSTAMAITHRRNQKEELATGSERVQGRSLNLIQHLQTAQLTEQAAALAHSLHTGNGTYQAFLTRWGYDAEQQQAMAQALKQTGLL
jgi:hypothetical protein